MNIRIIKWSFPVGLLKLISNGSAKGNQGVAGLCGVSEIQRGFG